MRGSLRFSPAVSVAGGIINESVITPSQITGDVDDWNPSGLASATVIRISAQHSDPERHDKCRIFGIVAQPNGKRITLQNIGPEVISLCTHSGTASAAANKFKIGFESEDDPGRYYGILVDQSIEIQYDSLVSRWRINDAGPVRVQQEGGDETVDDVPNPLFKWAYYMGPRILDQVAPCFSLKGTSDHGAKLWINSLIAYDPGDTPELGLFIANRTVPQTDPDHQNSPPKVWDPADFPGGEMGDNDYYNGALIYTSAIQDDGNFLGALGESGGADSTFNGRGVQIELGTRGLQTDTNKAGQFTIQVCNVNEQNPWSRVSITPRGSLVHIGRAAWEDTIGGSYPPSIPPQFGKSYSPGIDIGTLKDHANITIYASDEDASDYRAIALLNSTDDGEGVMMGLTHSTNSLMFRNVADEDPILRLSTNGDEHVLWGDLHITGDLTVDGTGGGGGSLPITYVDPVLTVTARTNVFVGQSIKVTLHESDLGEEGPYFDLNRDDTSGRGVGQKGTMRFVGFNNGSDPTAYAEIINHLLDESPIDAKLTVRTIKGGTEADRAHIGSGMWMEGATGGDPGVGKINCTEIQVNGTPVSGTSHVAYNDPYVDITAPLRVFCSDATVTVTDTQADHTERGPFFDFTRQPSGAGFDGDELAVLRFIGFNDAGTPAAVAYGQITSTIVDSGAGSEDGSFAFATTVAGTLATRMTLGAGLQVGSPTGGDPGAGKINVSGDVQKNGAAYTNPDYAFEHYFSGKIERFKDNPGADTYQGLMPLEALEEHVRTNYQLPRVSQAVGIFERSDVLLEKFEELTLYAIEANKRIKTLEARLEALESR